MGDSSSAYPAYLKPLLPFFKSTADFSSITKPIEVLDLPLTTLKVVDENWTPFFDSLDLKTIRELAQYNEPLVVEGLDPNDLNKVAMIAEMIFWKITQIAEHGDQKKKIVFFGLDNAGKSSALTALSEHYSSLGSQLLPTRGLVRTSAKVLGYELMSFDFGGQSQYRDQYFEKADMYFSSTDLMVFCLDIQDKERYSEALDYLKRILDTYRKYKLIIPVLIDFTKMDPDIANDEEINKSRIELIEKIEELGEGFDIGYTNSSIFERNSIENLFSMALKRISTSGGVIQELLRQYAEDTDARACTLISSSGLVYGSYGETQEEEEMLNNTAAYLQNLYLFHVSQGLQKEDFYMMQYSRNNLYFIAEYIMDSESGMVYLWVLTHDLRKEVRGIGKFREEIMPLIEIFL